MAFQQTYTPEQALQKAKQYCAYQERCHQEAKDKLYSYGLNRNDVDDLLSKLIEENYLNEERFAIQFAGGKFRVKQWGRVKIKYELKQKRVSDYCIRKALASIADDDYDRVMKKLFEQKMNILRTEKQLRVKKRKLQQFLLQKGYEADLVREMCKGVQ